MSAISGYFSFGNQPVDPAILKKVGNVLASQGPDAIKTWQSGQIGLVHRLMRITPEDLFEQQPLIATAGRYVLTTDACIDNRDELVATFGWNSTQAQLLPDSRFVMEAWLRWGEYCGRQLVGSYCIAVWDNKEGHLTLIRDPIGMRPVHYFHSSVFFAFATMPKGLFAIPGVPRELNEEKLADFLVLNHRDHRSTHYKHIYRVAPGHYIRVSPSGITEKCYWQPVFEKRLSLKNDNDYVDAFNELFDKVIRSHLRCRTSVSAFMSGGLDSSSIAVTAAGILRESGKRLATFTHVPRPGFDGPVPRGHYADESDRVGKIAAMHDNIDLNLMYLEEEQTLTYDSDNFFDCMELPFRNPANRLWMEAILREQQKRGVKVILTGVLGNYTFSWHGYQSLPQALRRGNLWRVLRETLALSRAQNRPWWRVFGGQALLPLMPRVRGMYNNRKNWRGILTSAPLWDRHSAIHPDFARHTSVAQRGAALGHDFRYTLPLDTREARWFMLMETDYLADLHTGWKARFGVEQRHPAMDRRILEFCLSIPEEQFLSGGVDRRLIKRAFAQRLPAAVLDSRERGLQAPDWYEHLSRQKQQLSREIQQLEKHRMARRYLDVERLRDLVENWPSQGWAEQSVCNRYRLMLARGVMVGRFVRWFEGDNQC